MIAMSVAILGDSTLQWVDVSSIGTMCAVGSAAAFGHLLAWPLSGYRTY